MSVTSMLFVSSFLFLNLSFAEVSSNAPILHHPKKLSCRLRLESSQKTIVQINKPILNSDFEFKCEVTAANTMKTYGIRKEVLMDVVVGDMTYKAKAITQGSLKKAVQSCDEVVNVDWMQTESWGLLLSLRTDGFFYAVNPPGIYWNNEAQRFSFYSQVHYPCEVLEWY